MKKQLKVVLIVMLAAVIAAAVIMVFMALTGRGNLLLPVGTRSEFIGDTDTYPSMLTAKGSRLVDESGGQVVLSGVSVGKPDEQYSDGNFNEDFYDGIWELGGNAVRVQIDPEAYSRDDYYLWRYLDRIVTWAGENDNYVILDWDYTGNPIDGSGDEMPDMDVNPLDNSAQFWNEVAAYFKETPNVIYEIYNEPVGMSDTEWKRCADSLISVIRDAGAEQLVIVASPDYCYDLDWIDELGMDEDNIAFSVHLYPDREHWKSVLSRYVSSYPVIVTEWGFTAEVVDEAEAQVDSDESSDENENKYAGTAEDYGTPLAEFMEENSVSWTACWYDDGEEPAMFAKDYRSMTEWGDFVSSLLKDE